MTNLKPVKLWHGFLIVATVAALCAPRMMGRATCGKGGCGGKGHECPYESDGDHHRGTPGSESSSNDEHTG